MRVGSGFFVPVKLARDSPSGWAMVVYSLGIFASMIPPARSIRPFIGSKDFNQSRSFYRDLGFEESVIDQNMSVFYWGNLSFYLQNYYAKDWVDNTMVFMEVEDVAAFWEYLKGLGLEARYPGVRLVPPRILDWGSECFVHDPAGVLWHFGMFTRK